YINQAGGDLRLSYSSSAIHAGTTTGAPAADLLGNPRGSNPDAGAYQYTVITTASAIAATPTIAFNGQVATFVDASGTVAPVGEVAATISWGDGTAATAGTITQSGSGATYVVSGGHTYSASGQYTLSVTVTASTRAPLVTGTGSNTATVTLLPTVTAVA